jgi:hypothetical protein
MTPITPRLRFVVTPHTVFRASCSSPKTPHSANRSVTTPKLVAARLPPASRALSIAAWTARAPE